MALKAYWAYAFTSSQTLGAMLVAWNDAGPWSWQMRESSWYGDYLSARPQTGVRVRIHEPATQNSAVGPDDPRAKGRFTALLEIEEGSRATQADIDAVVRRLLATVTGEAPQSIAPYD